MSTREQVEAMGHPLANPPIAVSQSAMASWLLCPQQWAFRYLYWLAPRLPSLPLIIGEAYHNGLEKLILTERLDLALLEVDKVFDREQAKGEFMTADFFEKLTYAHAQSTACVKAWAYIHSRNLPFKILHVEQRVFPGPNVKHSSHYLTRMAGKIDGVVQETESGRLMILEHKTKNTLQGADWVRSLDLDHQAMWYLLLGRVKAVDWELPASGIVTGFYYDVIMKPKHTAAPSWPSLVERMVEAMCADPQKYTQLVPVLIDQSQVDTHAENISRVLYKMDRPHEYMHCNFTACNNYYNGMCPYWQLCRNGADALIPSTVLERPEVEVFEFLAPFQEIIGNQDKEKAE